MSFNTSPFGQQPPNGDPASLAEEPEAPSREPLDPRVGKSLLAGALAVALLGAGTAGFLWLSSMPSGDSAEALAGSTSTPAVSQVGVVSASGVAFGGGDPFAGNGVVTSSSSGATTTDSGSTVSTSSSSSGSSSTGAGSSATTAASTVATTAPSGSSTTSPAPGTSSTTAVSSAPGWTAPNVKLEAAFAGHAVFDVEGESVVVLAGDLVYPLSVRYEGILISEETASSSSSTSASSTEDEGKDATAILSAAGDTHTGWLVPAGNKLPDAVVGKTSGTVRAYGYLADQYWVRVDKAQGSLIAIGDAVESTGLTFLGPSVDAYSRPGSDVWFSDGTVTYFGQFGAGESDGVSF